MLLSTNSFQSAPNGNEIQSAFLHYTPSCWIICFSGCIAAADGPLPFKVKQTLHSASPHSHREKKLVFSHLGSFLLFHPMHPWERGFLFGHPNSGQGHAVQCCIHTPPFSLPALSHARFSGGPQLSACILTAERANLVTCYQKT